MPVISISLFVGVCIGGILSYKESIVAFLRSTECYIRYLVARKMDANDPLYITNGDVLPHEKLIHDVLLKLNGTHFGLFVLAAPRGSGKSSIIEMALKMNSTSESKFKIKLVTSYDLMDQEQYLHKYFNIPNDSNLSEYLPENSIILLDQVSLPRQFNTHENYMYLARLARDSFDSRKYKIVLSISDVAVAKKIRQLDLLRIHNLCSAGQFIWSKNQADQYMEKNKFFKDISTDDKQFLLDLAKQCYYSPEFLDCAANSKEFSPELKIRLKLVASFFGKSWREFIDMDADDVDYRKLVNTSFVNTLIESTHASIIHDEFHTVPLPDTKIQNNDSI